MRVRVILPHEFATAIRGLLTPARRVREVALQRLVAPPSQLAAAS
jgi:hypothetical protein